MKDPQEIGGNTEHFPYQNSGGQIKKIGEFSFCYLSCLRNHEKQTRHPRTKNRKQLTKSTRREGQHSKNGDPTKKRKKKSGNMLAAAHMGEESSFHQHASAAIFRSKVWRAI